MADMGDFSFLKFCFAFSLAVSPPVIKLVKELSKFNVIHLTSFTQVLCSRPQFHDSIVTCNCSPWRMLLIRNSTIPSYDLLTNVAMPFEDAGI